MQRIADKYASWLTPVAMMIAIITGLVTQDIVRAVTILVVFCPCALVLATICTKLKKKMPFVIDLFYVFSQKS